MWIPMLGSACFSEAGAWDGGDPAIQGNSHGKSQGGS